jgi:hypothetical protein
MDFILEVIYVFYFLTIWESSGEFLVHIPHGKEPFVASENTVKHVNSTIYVQCTDSPRMFLRFQRQKLKFMPISYWGPSVLLHYGSVHAVCELF